jgi:PIN domain nuclease of toxin-antitoxin system
MKLLLDTHTFIWWDSQPAKLSQKALALCQEPTNILLLSVASIWEMLSQAPTRQTETQSAFGRSN